MSTPISTKVARRVFIEKYAHTIKTSYKATGILHKMMGKIISTTIGITDAPEEFFTTAEALFDKMLADKSMERDLENPDVYPILRRAINETVTDMDLA